jgi:thymidine phosphorylase
MTFREACDAYRARKADRFEAASDAVVAVAQQGTLSADDIATLARSMASSGESLVIPSSLNPTVDVPSTGGPASLTTLLCPVILATLRDYVPKLSATGSVAGGIDTMALIPGFRSDLAGEDFISALTQARFAHAEPSDTFCPADAYLVRARRQANMMANAGLAAASLLAKKVAIPGVACVFDFRVGRSGNIGATTTAAQQTADLFRRVARILGIKLQIVLTDNDSFPCSALGRLESLELLWRIITDGDDLLELDRAHFELCAELAVRAHELVGGTNTSAVQIRGALISGFVRDAFMRHIAAQGANDRSLHQVLDIRAGQTTRSISVDQDGYWLPPPVDAAKNYIKNWQSEVLSRIPLRGQNGDLTAARQVGLRLLVSPGSRVHAGQPVVELRFPQHGQPKDVPMWLGGKVVRESPILKPQLIGEY